MSGNSVTKEDLEQVETKLGRRIEQIETKLDRRIDGVETRLDRRIDGVEVKLDIVARQVGLLIERVDTMATRDDLAALREDMNRDIARHMEAGFEMMRRLFAAQDDRARSIEDKHVELRYDFTEHTRDLVLHNKS